MQAPELSPRPLRDNPRDRRLFVGRETDLDLCFRVLLNEGNVLLLGRRGIGKSSFLRLLAGELRGRGQDVVVIDGRAASSAAEFIGLIRRELGAWSTTPSGEAIGGLGQASPLLAEAGHVGRPVTSEAQLLLDELRSMRQALERRRDAIVLVDEVPSPEIGRILFGRLRDELWELPLVWCVTAEVEARGPLVEPPADAFWSRVVTLEPLAAAQGRDLLERRLGDAVLDAGDLDQLVEEAHGNPRNLLALASAVVVERRPLQELLRERETRDEHVRRLSPTSQRVLDELLAVGPSSPSDDALQTSLGLSRGRLAQVFKELETAGLVRSYSFASGPGRPRRVFEAV